MDPLNNLSPFQRQRTSPTPKSILVITTRHIGTEPVKLFNLLYTHTCIPPLFRMRGYSKFGIDHLNNTFQLKLTNQTQTQIFFCHLGLCEINLVSGAFFLDSFAKDLTRFSLCPQSPVSQKWLHTSHWWSTASKFCVWFTIILRSSSPFSERLNTQLGTQQTLRYTVETTCGV